MTFDQLVAFLAVAREGSFTAASASLHKSQPAVSKLVRNLEDELGVELFDRGSYRAALSDAGRLFYERAAAVVEETDALRSFGMELGGKIEPIVRLAIEAAAPLAPIMTVLRDVRERFPAVRLELSTERLAGAADALHEERADLVVATRLGVRSEKVEAAHFCSVRIVPLARFDHPLATCGVPIPPVLLRTHPQIVLRDSARGSDSPSLNVLEGGLRWSVTDVAAKRDIILAGMGWGGLPEHVAAGDLADGVLVALQVPAFEVGAMEVFTMRRRDRAHGVVARALWDALRSVATRPGARRRPGPRPR
jgi:DNA-binding transcriptional LysR family regulator